MERGRIVETGAHRALLEQDGLYARLYRIQFELGEAAVAPSPRATA